MNKLIAFVIGLFACSTVFAEGETVQVPMDQVRVVNEAIQQSTQRILKVGENKCKVQRVLKDDKGKDVVIAEFEYGADHVFRERALILAQIENWKNPDWIAKNLKVWEDKLIENDAKKSILES